MDNTGSLEPLRGAFRWKQTGWDLDEELRAHIDLAFEENLKRGMSNQDARTAALREFGGVTQTREAYRMQQGIPFVETLARDARYAVRQLRKSPVFAATAILTLALGIGATTAIFTVMNAVLLRSLPVPNPQQLVYLHTPDDQPYGAFKHRRQRDLVSRCPSSMHCGRTTAHFLRSLRLHRSAWTERLLCASTTNLRNKVSAEMVSGNFFSGLGVTMARGRGFALDDENQNSAVVVLSYEYWSRRFSRNPFALGQTMYVKGIPFTIVGVAREGFPGVNPGGLTDFWMPLQRMPQLNPWGNSTTHTLYGSPDWWCLQLIARLNPGVTAKQAVAEATQHLTRQRMPLLASPPDATHPKVRLGFAPAKGIQGLGDYDREPILILMALVTLVLLIACSNVAMLIVARNAARQRDFSLRMALGAQRSTLLRQLFTESCLLVLSGSLLGWLFALSGARALAAWSRLEVNLTPDTTILLFACCVSVVAATLFALAPLRTATNAPVNSALRVSAATSYQRRKSGSAVLALQVALCFTLLTAAGLLLRTLLNFEGANLGMQTDSLLVFGVTPQNVPNNDARLVFYRTLLDRVRVLPGVESATLIQNRPGSGWSSNEEAFVDGVKHPFEQVPLRLNLVGPDFLSTFGIPLLAGRDIQDRDTSGSERVAIVNETFVKKLLPNTNPIGHQLGDPTEHTYRIVGVARDSKYRSVDEAPRAMAYLPYTQDEAPPTMQIELRTAGSPLALLASVEKAVHEIDPSLPLEKPMTQGAVFADSYADQRLFARLAMFSACLRLCSSASDCMEPCRIA
jgi:predicted permease